MEVSYLCTVSALLVGVFGAKTKLMYLLLRPVNVDQKFDMKEMRVMIDIHMINDLLPDVTGQAHQLIVPYVDEPCHTRLHGWTVLASTVHSAGTAFVYVRTYSFSLCRCARNRQTSNNGSIGHVI